MTTLTVCVSEVKVTEIALVIIVALLAVTNCIELCCFFYIATGQSVSSDQCILFPGANSDATRAQDRNARNMDKKAQL